MGGSAGPLLLVKNWMGLPEVEEWEAQEAIEDEEEVVLKDL